MAKKQKEPYVVKTGLLGNAEDYAVYNASLGEVILWFLMGFAVSGIVLFIFYENVWVSLIVGIICGIAFVPMRRKQVINKRKRKLVLQFKEMLDSISTSIGAGKNVTDAFFTARDDLVIQFTADSDIVREVEIINQGINNGYRIEDMLLDFADRSEIVDVRNFANVFATCYLKGGNIKEIIKNTTKIIGDKIDIELEIATMVAGPTNEMNIMLFLPPVFVQLLKGMGDGIIDLKSPTGIISVTAAIVIFGIAYFVGKKITDVKL